MRGVCARVAPGGSIVISTPNTGHPQECLRDVTHHSPIPYDQLAGWLEGLFHGIRARLWGQQVAVQRSAMQNLEARHTLDAKEAKDKDEQANSSGLYL